MILAGNERGRWDRGEAKSGVARAIKKGIKTPAIYGPSASRGIIVIGDISWRHGATRGQLAGAIKELRRVPCPWVSPFNSGFRGRPARFKAGRSQSQRIAKDRFISDLYLFFCFAKYSNLLNCSSSINRVVSLHGICLPFIWNKIFVKTNNFLIEINLRKDNNKKYL